MSDLRPEDRLAAAYAAIDRANADDPTGVGDPPRPYAVFYGERMSAWLERLVPDASDALRIAVRGQHIRRFDRPRSEFPMDKPGYFAWRNRLKDHHADLIAGIMTEVGYGEDDIQRARSIVRKERLKRDPEAQALEDCACLVFLEQEFAPFAARHEDDKIVDIVAKTWVKMSAAGHEAAAAMVPALPERLQRLVGQAVASAAARSA
ncbi:DUF4202 domain-containing protein [Prosthecodimorpha staleyi]|uniref:DUF4202 domain-containing protein n=1 Tax=Prosthecodimorpha staleyi TaxID=2840188 RepID=A0A947DBM5_9HYPH|nr:DUF4202 domain-containing protein [Prosthecodimorpha staleyi]MBT9292782.1 DUF4202 domain-containing protein [Prosthecodimorpha staleyi]